MTINPSSIQFPKEYLFLAKHREKHHKHNSVWKFDVTVLYPENNASAEVVGKFKCYHKKKEHNNERIARKVLDKVKNMLRDTLANHHTDPNAFKHELTKYRHRIHIGHHKTITVRIKQVKNQQNFV